MLASTACRLAFVSSYVKEGMDEAAPQRRAFWSKLALGGEEFVQRVRERIKGKKGLEEVSKKERFVGRPTLEKLFRNTRRRKDRNARMREAFLQHGYRLNEIAAAVGLHYTRVSHIVNEEGKG